MSETAWLRYLVSCGLLTLTILVMDLPFVAVGVTHHACLCGGGIFLLIQTEVR